MSCIAEKTRHYFYSIVICFSTVVLKFHAERLLSADILHVCALLPSVFTLCFMFLLRCLYCTAVGADLFSCCILDTDDIYGRFCSTAWC